MHRDDFTAALTTLFGDVADAPHDRGANGLQVPGKEQILRVATGVSASRMLIDAAVSAGADALIVHHGLWFPTAGAALSIPLASRLNALFRGDMSLYGYHYLLDVHPEVGNAAGLIRALGAEQGEPFGMGEGKPWGYEARFHSPMPLADLRDRLERERGSALPAAFTTGPADVRRMGVVTGSGSFTALEAQRLGLDAIVVGEVSEGTQEEARELGMSVLAMGHSVSETYGPKALAAWITRELGLEAQFIDVPNPA